MYSVFWNKNKIAFFYRKGFSIQFHKAFSFQNYHVFAVVLVFVGFYFLFYDNTKAGAEAVTKELGVIDVFGKGLSANTVGRKNCL